MAIVGGDNPWNRTSDYSLEWLYKAVGCAYEMHCGLRAPCYLGKNLRKNHTRRDQRRDSVWSPKEEVWGGNKSYPSS